ncbi:ASKHA domain-containing protein [Thermoanaerobacter wiegelii]|uniref:ASKHA domain-containing protein n=1 Tax=Thermoanaerobacter wiegelii TaxID=46354 RepID=UPI001FCB7B0D|nr:ASKHA domain-containing protein [Thermoanaerobacter wiegelii]
MKEYKDEKAFQLDEENGIYLTQKDIRQIQLAKGAIYAGIKVLIKEMGIKAKDIKKMYFAGGFGNYISVESAATIGLIPKELKDRVEQIGNAAGTGAVMALLSEDELKKTEEIKKMIKYIELSSMPSFQEEFMYAMYFKN